MKSISILGITGSIGTTALNSLKNYGDSIKITSASCHTNIKKAIDLCNLFSIHSLCITSKTYADKDMKHISETYNLKIYKNINDMLSENKADIVLNGISGSSGLSASINAIECGCKLALANKETVVLGGSAFFDFIKKHNGAVIPVDSEHSAIDELLIAHKDEEIKKLIITASGGPFLERDLKTLSDITPAEAAKHPTWNMGQKISIDSATLANKGLEVIEAHYLFGFPSSDIDVVIHKQSIVHSMIRTVSGQVYAQMSKPNMSGPIMRALLERNYSMPVCSPPDFTNLVLSFSEPDFNRFPLLKYAFQSAKSEGEYPIVYNIADEVAVDAFIKGKIKFTEIENLVCSALNKNWKKVPTDVKLIPEYVEYVRNTLNEPR